MFQIFNGKATFDGLRIVVRKKATKEQRKQQRKERANEEMKEGKKKVKQEGGKTNVIDWKVTFAWSGKEVMREGREG